MAVKDEETLARTREGAAPGLLARGVTARPSDWLPSPGPRAPHGARGRCRGRPGFPVPAPEAVLEQASGKMNGRVIWHQ